MRAALAAIVLLAFCLVPGSRVVAQAEVYTNEEYGFSIERPAGWTFSEPDTPEGALYGCKFAKVANNTETSVTVYVVQRSEAVTESKSARDASEAKWKDIAEVSNISRGKGKLLGEDAYFLRATYDTGAADYGLKQHFLVKGDYIYVLQSLAPETEFETAEKTLWAILETFKYVAADPDLARLRQIAAMCGRDIAWAEDWQHAAAAAKQQNRLVLVVFEVYRGLDIKPFTLSTLFMHRDIAELVSERFVPMFWTVESRAPFDDPRVYGLGSSTFGQGIMFATPEGKIVGQCATFDTQNVYERCRDVLAANPGAPAKDPADTAELLRRGDLDAAATLLASPEGANPALQGRLLRLQRKGEPALEALKSAADTLPEQALTLLGMGEAAKAQKLLAKAESPEGKFWHCIARANQKDFDEKDVDGMLKDLRELALANPENHWGHWAAALYCEPMIRPALLRMKWPSEAQFESWRMPVFESVTDADAAREDAIRFLLESQAADGRWINPRSNASEIFDFAITAICGISLLPYIENELAKEAATKALDLLLKQELRAVPEALFDYTIWAQVFAVDFMARCIEAGVGDKAKCLKAINGILKDMEQHQYPSGGWGYFHSPDAPDNSIGFVTAAAVLALKRADKAGAKLPARMIDKACAALVPLHKDGPFGYMWATPDVLPGREAEAAMRSPLCALALKRGGKLEPEDVRKSLDVYLKFHAHTRAERGKVVCHTGPEGTAAYYLLFGYRFAAEALFELPKADRETYRKALTEDVLAMHMSDGSFCDFPSVGREYGAAMALTALHLMATSK